VTATRGRGGGTFVADDPPAARAPSAEVVDSWRETCDVRLVVDVGVALLAAERATADDHEHLSELVVAMDDRLEDFSRYRPLDVRLHVGLAECTGSARLVTAMTDVQGQMGDLIAYIPHPPEVLAHSNAQHARLLAAIASHDASGAVQVMTEHLQGTEHILAGLLPPP
jgi:GntR family transcriptional repressor for pyruvate dehydrogenase complex